MLDKKYILLQQEGFLTRFSLLQGLHSLRKGNLGDNSKGHFYLGFTNLAIGFERIMKMILLINHMRLNQLTPLTDDELRDNYGHKIKKLYSHCSELAVELGIPFTNYLEENEIEKEIIHFLHEFALSARFYNLSMLSNSARTDDPLNEWYTIQTKIFNSDVSQKKKNKILQEGAFFNDLMGSSMVTFATGLDQQLLSNMDTFIIPNVLEASAPYLVWRIIKILNPFYDLISKVTDEAQNVNHQTCPEVACVPYMTEFFDFLKFERSWVLRKRAWV